MHKNWAADGALLLPARDSYAQGELIRGPISNRAGRGNHAGEQHRRLGAAVIIFDCNGVLVDSEPIAAAVAAQEFARVGIPLPPELVAQFFFGRRPAVSCRTDSARPSQPRPSSVSAPSCAPCRTRPTH